MKIISKSIIEYLLRNGGATNKKIAFLKQLLYLS